MRRVWFKFYQHRPLTGRPVGTIRFFLWDMQKIRYCGILEKVLKNKGINGMKVFKKLAMKQIAKLNCTPRWNWMRRIICTCFLSIRCPHLPTLRCKDEPEPFAQAPHTFVAVALPSPAQGWKTRTVRWAHILLAQQRCCRRAVRNLLRSPSL